MNAIVILMNRIHDKGLKNLNSIIDVITRNEIKVYNSNTYFYNLLE